MRYLRQQNINRRAPYDQRLYVDMTNSVVMTTTNNMLMPKGTTAERPVSPVNGMIRYNTTLNEVEIYQATTWRSLRFKESVGIVQQSLGVGNAVETVFGALNPAPPAYIQSGDTWGGQNLIVVVENVIQLHVTNYTILQNPARATGTILSFTSGTNKITSSNTSVINFSTLKFQPGQSITVSGSSFNNGIFTISNVTASEITVSSALTDESAGATVSLVGPYALGYYVVFGDPVPIGKPVTVLHGFDK